MFIVVNECPRKVFRDETIMPLPIGHIPPGDVIPVEAGVDIFDLFGVAAEVPIFFYDLHGFLCHEEIEIASVVIDLTGSHDLHGCGIYVHVISPICLKL